MAIAIIAVLIGLLLPAVQKVREAALAGCGDGDKKGPNGLTEAESLDGFITSMADFASIPDTMARQFAPGAAPPKADLKKYQKYSYQLEGKPRVQDGTATMTVKLLQNDQEVGRQEWTAVKDDKGWKLKSAPLP